MDDRITRLKSKKEAELLAKNAERLGRMDVAAAARARGEELAAEAKAESKSSSDKSSRPASGASPKATKAASRLEGESLYINGVFRSVLEEILAAQEARPGSTGYLQPYSKGAIRRLKDLPPSHEAPWRVYMSCTNSLAVVSYEAEIVEWYDKTQMRDEDIKRISAEIAERQPSERGVHMGGEGEEPALNLLGIRSLKRLEPPISITGFIKTSDDLPLKDRTRSGGWSYVLPPVDSEAFEVVSIESVEDAAQKEAVRSARLSKSQRQERLAAADPVPKPVMVVSRAYIRNQDVVREVLDRAAGHCEDCKDPAPFVRASDGTPYLEVHHIVMLSRGGLDTVDNALALCPNCHRKRHFGATSA